MTEYTVCIAEWKDIALAPQYKGLLHIQLYILLRLMSPNVNVVDVNQLATPVTHVGCI